MKKAVTAVCLALATGVFGCAREGGFPSLSGPYLGQAPPGAEPKLFAPGVVSTALYERDIAVTPDGDEIFYGLIFGQRATIMHTRLLNGRWTEPEVAGFARDLDFYYLEPGLAPDGSRLYFLSTKAPAGTEPKPGWANQNIWAVDRRPDGTWGEAYLVGPPISTDGAEYFPSVTRDGTIYFARRAEGGRREKIFRAPFDEGSFGEPEELPAQVNGDWTIYNACIAPDESFLVGCVVGKDPEITKGLAHYYVFFRDADGAWGEGVNLGEKVNPPGAQAMSPSISPDGKYFFFASTKAKRLDPAAPGALTWRGIREFYDGPQNGLFDIYWVEASFIETLRKSPSE